MKLSTVYQPAEMKATWGLGSWSGYLRAHLRNTKNKRKQYKKLRAFSLTDKTGQFVGEEWLGIAGHYHIF